MRIHEVKVRERVIVRWTAQHFKPSSFRQRPRKIMSRSSSPFFREYEQKSEVSPLLVGDMTRQTRFDGRLNGTGGSQRKAKPSRTSMPLVYTDFRSPDAPRTNPVDTKGLVNKDDRKDDTSSGSHRTPQVGQHHPLKDAINRHSFVTNLETIGSRTVWVVLLTPIVLGVVAYFATAPWRYRSWTTPFTDDAVAITAPRALHQAGYVRSFISIPGYTCGTEYCDADILNIEAHRVTQGSDGLKPVSLLRTHLNLTQYVSAYYTSQYNDSVSTNKTVFVPLPMLRLDAPVYGLNPNDDKIRIEASFVGASSAAGPDAETPENVDANTVDINSILYADSSHQFSTKHHPRSLTTSTTGTTTSTIEIVTSTRTYILTVAILQILISLVTLICLLRIVGHIYVNAVQLRDKFASVHAPNSTHSTYGTMHSALSVYDSSDDMLTLDTDRAETTIWHFVLPEQYSAVFMLFFLFLWQGLLPALCVVCYDIGLHVSEGILFSAGIVTSVAQYGLLFTLIVYIDGLKYHATPPYKPRVHSGSTVNTHAYDPFGLMNAAHTAHTSYADTHSAEYWRRSTARVCTFDTSTPLQREYKSALVLYITYHHPCSIEFVGFLYKKLLMLLLTWVVVVLYWLLYYPRLWHRRALTQLQYDDIVFRYDILWFVLLGLSVVWGYWIVQVSVSTGLRLRKLKLNASRFRQVAYRTLLFQMQLGVVVILIAFFYYAYSHGFFAHSTFTSYASSMHYLYAWSGYYGLLRPDIIHSPPLAVHSVEVLVFVTSLVYTIAFCMQPPQQDLNTSKFNIQAFVAMERSLPDYTTTTITTIPDVVSNNGSYALQTPTNKHAIQHANKALNKLKQHLLDEDYRQFMSVYLKRALDSSNNKRYFCIESALVLLEISYQTYFSVDAAHTRPVTHNKSIVTSTADSSNIATANARPSVALNNASTTSSSAATAHSAKRALRTAGSDNSMFSVSDGSSCGYSTANSPLHSSSNTTPRYNTTNTANTACAGAAHAYTANAAELFGARGGAAGKSGVGGGVGSSKSGKKPFFNPFDEEEEQEEENSVKDGRCSNPFGEADGSGGTGGGTGANPFDEEGSDVGASEPASPAGNGLSNDKRDGNPFDSSGTGLQIGADEPSVGGEGSDSGGDSSANSSASASAKSSNDAEEEQLLTPTNPFADDYVDTSGQHTSCRLPWNIAPPIPPLPSPPSPPPPATSASTARATATSTTAATTNPFESDSPETNNSGVPDVHTSVPEPVPHQLGGPKLNLAGLGYTLRDTFSCVENTVFGFLATESSDNDNDSGDGAGGRASTGTGTNTGSNVHCDYVSNRVVVSFRGSLLGNAVTNLKIAQVALPSLKRPRAYFTKLIREFSSGVGSGAGDTYHNMYGGYGAAGHQNHSKQRSDTLTSDDCDLIRDANIHTYPILTATNSTHASHHALNDLNASFDYSVNSDIQDDYHTLLHRMESAEDPEENDAENFVPPETASTTEQIRKQLQNTQLAQNISSVGKNIPIVNQGFKRVHAGFWQSYNSIREEYMRAVVCAIYTHRAQILHALQAQSNVSPAHSMYVSSSANTPTNSNRKHAHSASNTNSAIKALFGSPLGANNPFSPLFSPSHDNSNNKTPVNKAAAGNTSSMYPQTPTDTAAVPPSTTLEVVFCGHSLGAAIASLAAFELSENIKPIMEALAMEAVFNVPKSQALHTLPLLHTLPAPVVSLYMYGAPRVGNSVFATSLNKKIDNIYRMQVNGDVVTMLPKFVGFYRHAGTAVLLDDKERGNLIIQPSMIESSMLQYYTGSVHNHSLDKYRACLEACLEPAELTEYLTREFQNLHSSTANGGIMIGGSGVVRNGGDGGGAQNGVNSSVGGNNGRGSKRLSISKSDIPEWLVSNSAEGHQIEKSNTSNMLIE